MIYKLFLYTCSIPLVNITNKTPIKPLDLFSLALIRIHTHNIRVLDCQKDEKPCSDTQRTSNIFFQFLNWENVNTSTHHAYSMDRKH